MSFNDRPHGDTRLVPGFVSSSGYGDGGYLVEVIDVGPKGSPSIVAIRITFINEDD